MTEFFSAKIYPGSVYMILAPKTLHISSVAIEQDFAKIYFISERNKFILASLSQGIPQAPLNLKFSKGEHIMFMVEGTATVSMLGYWNNVKYKNFPKNKANQNTKGKKEGA